MPANNTIIPLGIGGLAGIGGLVLLVLFLLILNFLNTWLKALRAKAPVSFANLVAMRLRGVPNNLIVDARITASKADIELSTDELESHYLAQGNLLPTVRAMIAAKEANMNLSWKQACALDLEIKGTHEDGNPK